jgi:coenzyme F420-dependent glucose-6-phosphate dehydrogenase
VTAKWPAYRERQERMREAIEIIRALWTGEEVTYHGDYYRTKRARLWTYPTRPVPLYISSLAPEAAAFAGRYGDGLITVAGKEPDVYRKMLQSFEQGARDAGKDPSQLPRLIEIGVAYTQDAQSAIEARRKYWAGTFIPALFINEIYTSKMSQENGAVVGNDTVRQKVLISAGPDEHVRHAQQFLDLGFTDLYFHSAGPDQRAFIEGYGRDVLPRIRQLQERMQPATQRASR